ncbi:MAG: type II toxin-antitoxin system RelB/DinJ family antitoxin [Clostridia bacterium]|nr:type II toxin-antitoxin system RelB/DinJ family antitoxin [Clostridia bacterium]
MAKQAIYQVRMDEEVKEQVEALYRKLGTTFAEAVRIFAVQSIREQGMPFTPSDARGKSFGALSSLADPALIPQESGAFEKAMVAKHAHP